MAQFKAALVGNGINRLEKDESISWENVLEHIKSLVNRSINLKNDFKPEPLGFEEILHNKVNKGNIDSKTTENLMRKEISKQIFEEISNKKGFGNIQERIAFSNLEDIITTNYDYSIEKAINEKTSNSKSTSEEKHSVFRHYRFRHKIVWHIHGEINDSNSILMGFDHYSNYIREIINYVKGYKKNVSIEQKLKSNEFNGDSWIESFFNKDLIIFGLGLDFSENHIWWLLNFRAKIPVNLIKNKISFYYPSFKINQDESHSYNCWKINQIEKHRAQSDLLKTLNVEVKPIECDTYPMFYDEVLRLIR